MAADEHAFEELLVALNSEDDNALEDTVRALGELGDPRAIQPLIDLLRVQCQRMLDDDMGETIWNSAWDSLVKIGEPAVLPLIALLTGDDLDDMRNEAAAALAEIGDRRAVEPMIRVLEDTNESEVHRSIAYALQGFGDERAIEPLIKVVRRNSTDKGDVDVLRAAASALGTFGDSRSSDARGLAQKAIEMIRAQNQVGDTSAYAVGQSTASSEKLIAALQDTEPDVRHRAAVALGELGDWRGFDPLLEVLSSDDADLRYDAAEALGKLGEERALTALIWLKHKDEGETSSGKKVKDAAAQAIERIREANKDTE